jgi:cytochrome oxidase Cu insertion factor (SCO1/SenC/PrrC family)
MLTLILLAACGSQAVESAQVDPDTAEPPSEPGRPPESPVPLPTFTARAHTGEARTEADLVGHPTVMWFFPVVGGHG